MCCITDVLYFFLLVYSNVFRFCHLLKSSMVHMQFNEQITHKQTYDAKDNMTDHLWFCATTLFCTVNHCHDKQITRNRL